MNPTVAQKNPAAARQPQKTPVKVPARHTSKHAPPPPAEDLWAAPSGNEHLTLEEAYWSLCNHDRGNDSSGMQRAAYWLTALGPDTPLAKVTNLQVRRVLKTLNVADPTKNRYCSALSSLYTHAQKELEWEGVNPAVGFAKFSEGQTRQVGLSIEEVERLLVACLSAGWPKLRLLVLMAVVTGMRRSNLMALRYRDIDNGVAKIGRTKNGTPFMAVLPGELQAELKRFSVGIDPDALIFEGTAPGKPMIFDKQYKAACRRAGLPHINFHTLRHTCASIAARSGASTIEIMELLNHKTPTMAARYSHLNVEHRKKRIPEIFGKLAN